MKQVVLIFLAGGCGCLLRHFLGSWVQKLSGGDFPYGTLAVNVIGCLIFGFIWGLADARRLISDETRLILLTGFVGALTTFSTFAFDTHQLMEQSAWLAVAGNLAAQLILGILAIWGGIALVRLF